MGSKAALAQRARARQRAQRLARATSMTRGGDAAHARHVTSAAAEVRAALRARDRALRAIVTAEHRAGAALRRLTAEGLSLRHVARRCDLSVAVVRRLLAAGAPAQGPAMHPPSTDAAPPGAGRA